MEREALNRTSAVDQDSARFFAHFASNGPFIDKDAITQELGELPDLYRNMGVPNRDAKRTVQNMEGRLNKGSSSDQAKDARRIHQAREGLINAQEHIIYER